MKITVIGSFVMDMVARVDSFPEEGQTVLGKSIRFFPGGKGINQCVAAARLGAETEMIGMLGSDANGETFRKIMRDEHIISDRVFSCDVPTAVAQIQINNNGENKIVVIPSANHVFGEEQLRQIESSICSSEIVVLQLELRKEIVCKIIDLCAKNGVRVILNPAPAVVLEEELFSKIEYLTPNETEMEILTGMPTGSESELFAAADKLLGMGVKNIVATLGKRGALIANDSGKKIIPGFSVKAVDTVAAGDSFNGALATCIVHGTDLESAVRFANAVGALTVTKQGAIPSLPYLSEVEKFLDSHRI